MIIDSSQRLTEFSVPSDEAALFVRSVGGYDGGPVLVALHGGPGLSHEYLLPLVEQLAGPELRVVTYDQRGVGRSTGRAASSDPLLEWAADLEAIREALGAQQIHLLGHSAGGFVAVAYASTYPERTASITFVDSVAPTAAGHKAAIARFNQRIAELQSDGLIAATLPEDATEWLCAVMPVYFVNPHLPGIHDLNGARFDAEAHNTLLRALGDYDLRPRLSALTMPILGYIAETPFSSAMAGELIDALPQTNLRRFSLPNSGHLPWVEEPELFRQEVKSFLHSLIEVDRE